MGQKQRTPDSDEDLAQLVQGHGPCTYLLLSLFALILVYPYLRNGVIARATLGILYSSILIGAIYAIGQNRKALVPKIGLAALGIASQWTALLIESIAILRLAAATFAVFLALTIKEVLQYVLRRGPVTPDKLHGALAGYIMLAFLWAFIYALIESFTPGSFASVQFKFTGSDTFFHFLYFSFTTLTTTGFGDIAPVTDQARSLVILEEFTGIFFVGVLIARLAGLYPPTGANR